MSGNNKKKSSGGAKKPQTQNQRPQNTQQNNAVKQQPAAAKPASAPAVRPAAQKAPARPSAAKVPAKTGLEAVDYKEVGRIAAILTAICLIITVLLAGTNALTTDKIADNALREKQEACSLVYPADDYVVFEDARFEGSDAYLTVTDGQVSGAVITTTDKGYGGEIKVMTGIDMAGNITGVKILEHSETPGLGANAEKPVFLGQFVTDWQNGETRPESFAVTKDGGTIDAVTAATRSSRAVTRAVNSAIELFDKMKEAGALVLPEGYVPPQKLPVSGADVSASELPAPGQPVNEDGSVPTIVAGGEQ